MMDVFIGPFCQPTLHSRVMISPHQNRADWLRCCLICWLIWAHTGHILALDNAEGLNLYLRLLQHGPVWSRRGGWGGREGTYCPLRTLPHSFEEQPSLIINSHTKPWAPNNTEQIPLCAQVLNISATTACPPALPLLFRYLHISERCGRHKGYSQLSSFSPFCGMGQF